MENLLAIVERVGASDALAGGIRHLEAVLVERRTRIAALSATANDPVSAAWEKDVDEAIARALHAVRDITDEHMPERAELHQSLTRVIRAIYVWPNSHAAVNLRNDDSCIFLPLLGSPAVPAKPGEGQTMPSLSSKSMTQMEALLSSLGIKVGQQAELAAAANPA